MTENLFRIINLLLTAYLLRFDTEIGVIYGNRTRTVPFTGEDANCYINITINSRVALHPYVSHIASH